MIYKIDHIMTEPINPPQESLLINGVCNQSLIVKL